MDQNSQKTKKIREKENAILDSVSPKFDRLQKKEDEELGEGKEGRGWIPTK